MFYFFSASPINNILSFPLVYKSTIELLFGSLVLATDNTSNVEPAKSNLLPNNGTLGYNPLFAASFIKSL